MYPGDCDTCLAGYKCPKKGTVEPVVCGTGYFSGSGASDCTLCKPGYYCMLNTTTATVMYNKYICPAGMHCRAGLKFQPYPGENNCDAGYFCVQGNEVWHSTIFRIYHLPK